MVRSLFSLSYEMAGNFIWQYSVIRKAHMYASAVYSLKGYKMNILNIAVRMVSLIPLVAEQAARRWDEYHTERRERISPVAVCFEEFAWLSRSTNEM